MIKNCSVIAHSLGLEIDFKGTEGNLLQWWKCSNFNWITGSTSVCPFDKTHWLIHINCICFIVYNVYSHPCGFPTPILWKESLCKQTSSILLFWIATCLLFRPWLKQLRPLHRHSSRILSGLLHKGRLVYPFSICERMKILEKKHLCC